MARTGKQAKALITACAVGLSAGPRCAIYNRVSTSQQNPTLAIEDLRRAARQHGYEIALEVTETGSGKRNDRPGLQRVLDAARKGEIVACFVMRLDRFGRSSADLVRNVQALKSYGCRFVCVEQSIDVKPVNDAMGDFVLTIMAGVAELEHAIISDRVREGQQRAMRRGVVFGRPLVEGPAGDTVRTLRAQGRSWSEIADECECTVALARRRFAA